MGNARFEVIPEARHCAVMRAASDVRQEMG
jgi:hypothetical protein